MYRLFFSAFVLFSVPAFAVSSYTHSSVLSYNDETAFFGKGSSADHSIQVEYKFVTVPLTTRESDFTFTETRRCAFWINPPVSHDDDGECGRYELSGYTLNNSKGYDLFSVERSITNLQNGKVQRDVLSGKVTVHALVRRSFPANVDKSKLRLQENETFEAIISDHSTFGCFGNPPFVSAPLLGERATIGICSRLEGRALIEKRGNKFSVTLKGVPTFTLSADAPKRTLKTMVAKLGFEA